MDIFLWAQAAADATAAIANEIAAQTDWRVLLINNLVPILTALAAVFAAIRTIIVETKLDKNTKATEQTASDVSESLSTTNQMEAAIATLSESMTRQITAAVEDMRVINKSDIDDRLKSIDAKLEVAADAATLAAKTAAKAVAKGR